jgi:diguanylate cyclase (GGDEF)-like protein/PAS domain S-box-containing protein
MDKQVYRNKILVVDDETINIKMMINALKHDYITLVATSGVKALSLVRSDNPPDLILLDISMPEMDGYEVCRHIKSNEQFNNIPIIFISASDSEQEQVKGLELGAVDYLTKPVCLPILKAKIKSHLEMKQHRDFMEMLLDKQYLEMQSNRSLHEKDRLQQQNSIACYIDEIHEIQQRLKLSLWGSGDEFWNWNLQSGEYISDNALPLELERVNTRESLEDIRAFVHPEDFCQLLDRFDEHINGSADFFETSYRTKNAQGEWVWLLQRGKIIERDDTANAIRLSGTLRDISHFKQTEQELLLAAKSFENISDAVWVCDLDWKILKTNTAFTDITGFSAMQAIGNSLLVLMGNEYAAILTDFSDELTRTKEHWSKEVWGARKDGTYFPQELQISVLRDNQHNVTHYIGAFSDITQRKKTEDKLRYLANYDALTGLPNRTLFMERIQHAIDVAHRSKNQMAVIFLDLDNFKNINDTLGHSSGDLLLKEIGSRIASAVRDCDTAARLGGDEFTILLEKINSVDEIQPITKRILNNISKPFSLTGYEVSLTASIGIAIYPDYGSNYKDLLRYADIAMYHAKAQGRNNVQYYTSNMDKRTIFRLELEQQLHRLADGDQLLLHYQPKMHLATRTIRGLEALVRWQHPKHGLIPPDTFISMAEDSGHIVRIGEKILTMACLEAKPWWESKKVSGRLAVNLSAVQIAQQDLVSRVAFILQETGFLAKNLEFEVTESSMLKNKELAVKHMRAFQEMGIHLSIDDFGTGYSSLSSIKNLPVNTLKIDKSFINDIEHSVKDRGIVVSIISLALHLNLKVIAEGVETAKQEQVLMDLNCEEIQGYLFSRPLPAVDLIKFFDEC